MLVQIHSPEAFKLGLKSRWCEEFVSYWSAKPCASLAATVHRGAPLLGHTLALYTSPQVRSQGGKWQRDRLGVNCASPMCEWRACVIGSDKIF